VNRAPRLILGSVLAERGRSLDLTGRIVDSIEEATAALPDVQPERLKPVNQEHQGQGFARLQSREAPPYPDL
jgi:hypothetical protein